MPLPEEGETPRKPDEAKIDPAFRTGSLAAAGFLLGFTLNFLNRWAGAPESQWQWTDSVALVPLLIGVLLQLAAVISLFDRRSLYASWYDRAKNVFLVGFCLVVCGVLAAILLDIIVPDHPSMLG